MNKKTLNFILNGKAVEVSVGASDTLLQVLRDHLHLTGTKKGCGRGECGACTVILNDLAVNSCIIPAMKVMGQRVETIEGIGDKDNLHPLQETFADMGAVQCGFCTPGMIMSSKALLDQISNPKKGQIKEAISGNICRCTGYAKIEKAIKGAAEIIDKTK